VLKPMPETSALWALASKSGKLNLRRFFQPCVETYARNPCIVCIGFKIRKA
jgi:hypothetical protein